jgi:hypothetical protein
MPKPGFSSEPKSTMDAQNVAANSINAGNCVELIRYSFDNKMNERSFLFYAIREICQEQKDPNYDFHPAKISTKENARKL